MSRLYACVRAREVLLCLVAMGFVLGGCNVALQSRSRGGSRSYDTGGVDGGPGWIEPEPEPEPEPGPGPEPEPEPEPEPGPGPGPGPEPDPGVEPEPDPGPAPEPDPGPAPEPDPGPAPEPDPGPAPEPDPGPAPDPGACTYPAGASATINTGRIMPPYRWATAYTETGAMLPFDLAEFHCGTGDWGRYHSVLIIVSTGWCPNCPTYLREVAAMNLAARGTLVVFLESQDESYRSANSRSAQTIVNRTVGMAPGLRIGDGENSMRDALGDQTSTVPSGYFIRRSDMRVLADENQLGRTPDWVAMATDPDMDWPARFGYPAPPPPTPCTEETHEPNDTRATADAITPGTFSAGVCRAGNEDFFSVALPGRWRVDLDFRHADGDIDMFALDASGRVVGTSDSPDDDESLTLTGPATLRIIGYEGATASYRLTLTEL